MKTKALITSCSNKFFPSMINLLGSIKVNYPNHPPIYIYDLGLFYTFRKELEMIEGVNVIDMPHFCPHWRACYTWKTYIFAHPVAELNFYIDAGCQVLKPLDEDFEFIEKNKLLLIDIETTIKDLVPTDYKVMFGADCDFDNEKTFNAGIIGFSNETKVNIFFKRAYNCAKAGLTLGFSENSMWRNKGKNKSIFIRDCLLFRHDQTIINLMYQLYYQDKNENFLTYDKYHYARKNFVSDQKIWHLRTQWKELEFTKISLLHNKHSCHALVNRFFIELFIILKKTNALFKSL